MLVGGFGLAGSSQGGWPAGELSAPQHQALQPDDTNPESKAAARKARRTPPTPITPPKLPSTDLAGLTTAFSNGVLLIDKPLGWTSFDVCGKLRNTLKFTGVRKVGHAGTLDPLATGLLIVATGAGTKFCDDFMAEDKVYSGVLRLGEGTATYDAEGEVDERLPWAHITDEQLRAAAQAFLGDVHQVPPMYSAIKVKGQKLYDLAREGVTVERAARPVHISSLDVWRPIAGAQDVAFRVACSKGTYVRSLAHDLGRALGTVAHLTALRREASGQWLVADAWQLDSLLTQLQVARATAVAGVAVPEGGGGGGRPGGTAP